MDQHSDLVAIKDHLMTHCSFIHRKQNTLWKYTLQLGLDGVIWKGPAMVMSRDNFSFKGSCSGENSLLKPPTEFAEWGVGWYAQGHC